MKKQFLLLSFCIFVIFLVNLISASGGNWTGITTPNLIFYSLADSSNGGVLTNEVVGFNSGNFNNDTGSGISWSNGKYYNGLYSNASNFGINMSNGTDDVYKLLDNGDEITIEAWINYSFADEASYFKWLFTFRSEWNFAIKSGNLSSYDYGLNEVRNGVIPINDSQWHHIAMVMYSNNTACYFVDGQNDSCFVYTIIDGIYQDFSLLSEDWVGSYENNEKYIGYIDEIKIWNTTRSQEEIKSDMLMGSPIITLNSPINYYNSTSTLVNFNIDILSSSIIENISFWINASNKFELNFTNDTSLFGKSFFNQIYNLIFEERNIPYVWNIYGCDEFNLCSWGSNRTFTIDLFPRLSVTSPLNTTLSSSTFNITLNVNDTNLNNCTFNITRGASIEVATTSISITDKTIQTSVSSDASYLLNTYCNDMRGQWNTSTVAFTVDTSVPVIISGGGGGGGVTIVGNNTNWKMSTSDNTGKYEFAMTKGTSRIKSIKFLNLGTNELELDLRCEGTLCQYLTLAQSSITLPVGLDIPTYVDFEVNLPDNIIDGDYKANIFAKDQEGLDGLLTVTVNVGTGNFLISFLNKLGDSRRVGSLFINYGLMFILFFPLIAYLSYKLGLKKIKDIGLFISLIFSLIVDVIIIYLI